MARRKVLTPKPVRIYKVCSAGAWREALERGVYEGSADDLRDGYVHLSTAPQVAGVLTRYFVGGADLVAIALERAALEGALRWEANSKGEDFPHYYGALPVAAALQVHVLPDDETARQALAGALT